MAIVSASVLSCNTMNIEKQVKAAEAGGADFFHVDVMDGNYVENLTFGPQFVRELKQITDVPVSVHLELYHPERFLRMFHDAGADILTFQLDACHNPIHFIKEIKAAGMQAGIGIGPAYGVENLRYLLHLADRITLMSVEPGYGGQVFEESVFSKLRTLKEMMRELNRFLPVAVDGGVDLERGKQLIAGGADVLISGSYLFGNNDISERVKNLKSLNEKKC